MKAKIGVALAVHNSCALTYRCLEALFRSNYDNLDVVVVDDGSQDGTGEILQQNYPSVKVLRGDGNLWWAGGTNRAIKACLHAGCDYVLLLNPDVFVEPETITCLLTVSQEYGDAIAAALVVQDNNPNLVWWAGSRWGPIKPWFPVWTSQYLYRAGTPRSALPQEPYFTSEAHGRGVMIPLCIFEKIGLYDEHCLPHYGADSDFSHRVRQAGFSIFVVPQAPVRLDTANTGMKMPTTLRQAWSGYWRYLTQRKNGEALRIWWQMLTRHVPAYAGIPSYLFILGQNTFRYWQRIIRQ